MEVLGERPVWSMSGGEMASALDDTYAEIARLEHSALHLIRGLEATGHALEVGAGSTARFLTLRYRIDAVKARRDVHLASSLEKFPAVAAALPGPSPYSAETAETGIAEGGAGSGVLLHPAQAEAIVSVLGKVPAAVPVEDLRVAEREMVELARTHGPLDLRKAGVLICNRLDTDGPEPAEQKAYDRESLKLAKADNGVKFTGYLANENAELFRTLIHTYAKPHNTVDGAPDPRGRDKRQADALTTVLTTATNPTATNLTAHSAAAPGSVAPTRTDAAAGAADAASDGMPAGDRPADTLPDLPIDTAPSPARGNGFIPGHGPKAHISVTIDFNDLKAATADKIGHLIYGDGLSAATIRRLACDAQILPVVLGSNSQPLDVGTTVRLATGPMRKALIVRDKGCVCCGAPPIYCDAHHVKSWIDGGETKINNLVLLCKRCHRDLHAGHWDIHITNGIVHVARPTWATPDPLPRGRYRPPTTEPLTSATAKGGTPPRVWPRETDPPWITPEDAARLNPWGDAPDERPARTRTRPPAADFDPWGDGSSSTAKVDAHSSLRPSATVAFDPWADVAAVSGDTECSPGDGSELDPGAADGWPDSAEPRTTTAA